MRVSAVLITEDVALSVILPASLALWSKYDIACEVADFQSATSGIWREWLATADVFLVDLQRNYEWGPRAEGAALAKVLLAEGKRVVVVSREPRSRFHQLRAYWDPASEQSIFDAISRCLQEPVPAPVELEPLIAEFSDSLKRSTHATS